MSASSIPPAMTENGRQRVIIEGVSPEIDCGRFAAKRSIGDAVQVEADIFTDGHDAILVVLRFRPEKDTKWVEVPMRALVNDRWVGEFFVNELGRYRYTLCAWVDHWETWLRDLRKRVQAESDTPLDYQIGAELIEHAAERADGNEARQLRAHASQSKSEEDGKTRRAIATDPSLLALMSRYPDRRFDTAYHRELD